MQTFVRMLKVLLGISYGKCHSMKHKLNTGRKNTLYLVEEKCMVSGVCVDAVGSERIVFNFNIL